jgi:neutral ceramidase
MSVLVGVAVLDRTPPPGLAMSGFGARVQPAVGAHDPLTVRALAVDDAVLLTVDACGLHEDFCAGVRAALGGPVVVTATHTHGGPATVPGRLGGPVDAGYLESLAQACVAAGRQARAAREPASVSAGIGPDPGVARNRRRPDGPVHAPLGVIRLHRADGGCLATVVSYPCHPVVLGADNREWTADYPGAVRRLMEAAEPGSVCLFLTGCCGELNTGHRADASHSLGAAAARTFEAAERIGQRIAGAVGEIDTRRWDDPDIGFADAEVALPLSVEDPADTAALVADWERELPAAEPGRQALLRCWLGWAREVAPYPLAAWTARVSVLRIGGVRIVALPGEPFAATARDIAERVPDPCLVLGYADGCPGYLPPAEEYRHGGYEVLEAHRYYGMPGPFAPGAAETLADLAVALAGRT